MEVVRAKRGRHRRHRLGWTTLALAASLLLVAAVRATGASPISLEPSTPRPQTATANGGKIMVVGDSISQGLEGDFTWRYRLSEHFRAHNVKATFVGPWTGTFALPPAQPEGYPRVSAPPTHHGAYRPGITFQNANLAQWGWTVHQAKDVVGLTALRYQPDYLLVELGFNDLAYSLTSPAGLTDELHTLVVNARKARPSIKIVLANVVHGEPLGVTEGLRTRISEYDSILGAKAAAWSTESSPVALADIGGVYAPGTDSYDGIHPNIAGEIKIAKTFADVLASRYGVGPRFTATPAAVEEIRPSVPASIKATAIGGKILVQWSHSFGAGGYRLYWRDLTSGQQFQKSALPLAADSWTFDNLIGGHTYEYEIRAARGAYESEMSPVAAATAQATGQLA